MPEEGTPADSGVIPEEAPSPTSDSPDGDLPAALSCCQIAWQQAETWNSFIEALATVEATAMQAGHLALHDVCIALRERIVQLSEVQPCPDDEQCAVLATWPSFASAWAESPGEPRLGELLVEFLRHPMWPQPLGSDEAEILGVMLGVESGAYGTESLIETVIDTLYTTETADGDSAGDDGLPGYDGLSGYAKLGTGVAGAGRIVPDVRASMSRGIDSSEIEGLSSGMDLGGVHADEEEAIDVLVPDLNEQPKLRELAPDLIDRVRQRMIEEERLRVGVVEQRIKFFRRVSKIDVERGDSLFEAGELNLGVFHAVVEGESDIGSEWQVGGRESRRDARRFIVVFSPATAGISANQGIGIGDLVRDRLPGSR